MVPQVFICYSSRDQPYLEAFRVYLKRWEDDGVFTIWRDGEQLLPSDNWDDKIQEALSTVDIALILLSPDSLASDYVWKTELPILVRRREEGDIALTWLHLRACNAAHEDMAIPITLTNSTTRRINLLDYQGLHRADQIIDALPAHERGERYAEAAATLVDLIRKRRGRRPKPRRLPSLSGHELTIQLRLQGSHLQRDFFHGDIRIDAGRSSWPMSEKTDLFQRLFGSQEKCDEVLQTLFETDLARPIRHPVRVRIQTDIPSLAEQPWVYTAWEGEELAMHGWTFECVRADAFKATARYPDVTLRTPCSVMMIAPSHAPHADAHERDLQERLDHAWLIAHEPPHRVRDWASLQHTWQQRRPRIVYYYGPAEHDGQDLILFLDNDTGGTDRIVARELETLWRDHPPQIVFFNLVGDLVSTGTAMADLTPPLAITQYSHTSDEACRSALAWLNEVLEGGEGTDPVWALHEHGLSTAVAWTDYGYWQTQTAIKSTREQLPKLLIDRKLQRAQIRDAIDELVRDRQRRVCCVLAYGTEGNMVELFPEQLQEHLRRLANPDVQVFQVPMRLPTAPSFDVPRLELTTRQHLRLDERASIVEALAKRQPRGPGRGSRVLFLNWGARSTHAQQPLMPSALEAWLTFCSGQLALQCPAGLRLVCCLSVETTEASQPVLLDRLKTLEVAGLFPTPSFRLVRPRRLDHIELGDLADFLVGKDNTSCPSELIPVMPTLILQKTGGRFQSTVALAEQAEEDGWYALRDTLVAEFGEPQPHISNDSDTWS